MTTNEELKACPFCGSPAAKPENGFMPLQSLFYTWCSNEDCILSPIGRDERLFTIQKWNTRTTPDTPVNDELLVALRAAKTDLHMLGSYAKYIDEAIARAEAQQGVYKAHTYHYQLGRQQGLNEAIAVARSYPASEHGYLHANPHYAVRQSRDEIVNAIEALKEKA